MEHIASGVRRVSATFLNDHVQEVDAMVGIHFIGPNRCNITKAGLKKCTFCEEIGHYIRTCPLAPLKCATCKLSGHQTDKCSIAERIKAGNRGKKYRGQELDELPAEEETTVPAVAAPSTSEGHTVASLTAASGTVYDAFEDKFISAPPEAERSTVAVTLSTLSAAAPTFSTPQAIPTTTATASSHVEESASTSHSGVFTSEDINASFRSCTSVERDQRSRECSTSSSASTKRPRDSFGGAGDIDKRSRPDAGEAEEEEEEEDEEMDAVSAFNSTNVSTSTTTFQEHEDTIRRNSMHAQAVAPEASNALNSSNSSSKSVRANRKVTKEDAKVFVDRMATPKHQHQSVSQLSAMPPPLPPQNTNTNNNLKQKKEKKTPATKIRDMKNNTILTGTSNVPTPPTV